ncbi:MAG TPA: serine/threonine protein phosphatase [Lachnospiraceae bacterium]|nr:serine/threonine protein phosphatase [Lachnospiraceae bacterium]
MFDDNRLTKCYNNSLDKDDVIQVTEETKLIFFSDIHRGDNSVSDEFAHNRNVYMFALKHYFNNGFQYLEIGDGDELWENTKFEYIRSAHSDVFSLIKKYYDEDRFYYFYGNHNMIFSRDCKAEKSFTNMCDDFLDINSTLFPNIKIKESMILKDVITQKELLMIHGHQGDFVNDRGWIISMFFVRVFWRYMHRVGFQNPASPSKNIIKRHKIEINFSKWIKRNHIGILCGHTHRAKLPEKGDAAYLNTGCCIHPRGITGIELVGRKFSLVHWCVVPDEKGSMVIKKEVMKEPISFDEIEL